MTAIGTAHPCRFFNGSPSSCVRGEACLFSHASLNALTPSVTSTNLPDRTIRIAKRAIFSFDCTVIQNFSAQCQMAVVICHGYGANADNLSSLVHFELAPRMSSEVVFILPNGPKKLARKCFDGEGDGFAWWSAERVDGQNTNDISNDVPDGFLNASMNVRMLIDEVSVLYSLPTSKIVIGGFSQGGIVSIDVALKMEVAGLICWSAGMLNGHEWRKLAQAKNLNVFMSHGLSDTDIPFYAGDEVKEMFSAHPSTHALSFVTFEGGHGVPLEIVFKTANFLNKLLACFNKRSDC